MDIYAQLSRIHHDHKLQIFMYDFMYVDRNTMPQEDNFTDKKNLLITTRKFQLQDQYQNLD